MKLWVRRAEGRCFLIPGVHDGDQINMDGPLCLAQANIAQKTCYNKLRIDLMKKQAIIFGNFDCDIQAAVSCISLKNDLQ